MKMAKQRYNWAKGTAKRRGIPFLLTFDEWYNWWAIQGVDKNIPARYCKNSLVMCRINDIGPYTLQNIFCDTMSKNTSYGKGNRYGKPVITPLGEFATIKKAAKAHNVAMATFHTWLKTKPNFFRYK